MHNKHVVFNFGALIAFIILLIVIFRVEDELFDPAGLYLTWQQDPTTTMTIDWHTTSEHGVRDTFIQFKKINESEWHSATGTVYPFPFSDRTVHRVELTNLEPASTYLFRFGDDSKEYQFRTMPENLDEKPLIFAAGGDVMFTPERLDPTGIEVGQQRMEKTNRMVMEYADLDFIAWGGDLAYDDGDPDKAHRNHVFFETIKETLIDEDGRVVPIIVSTGNHEVQRGYWFNHDDYEQTDEWREQIAPYFFGLFAFPGQPGYGVLDFGNYLSMISIDSEHVNPIEGEQFIWLENVLSERTDVRYVFPFYHVPAFPSHRRDSDPAVTSVQKNLPPLFEKYGVRVAFENHDHTFNRSYPIKNGEPHEDGVIYMGDGAWGVHLRDGNRKDEWYIAKYESQRHAIIITLDGDSKDFVMLNEDGEIIDTYNSNDPISLPAPPPPPEPVYEPVLIYPPVTLGPRVERQPEFLWESVSNATEYQFQLAQGNFTNILKDSTVTDTTFSYPQKLEPDEYYRWRVRALNESGTGPWSDEILFRTIVTTSSLNDDSDQVLPSEYILGHNYPNPFNPITTITYGLPITSHVDLRIYDIIGREITILVNEEQTGGYHTVHFDSETEALGSGVYIYRLTATPSVESGQGMFTQTNIMTLIK